MSKQIGVEVSIACADAVGLCDVDVVAAYPITPQTHIVEQLWFDPAFFLTVTLASFGSAYLIHKLPLINKITG